MGKQDLGYSDRELLRKAVTFASPSQRKTPRWVVVMDIFHVGSTSAYAICEEFGLDPDEVLKTVRKN